MNPSSWDSWVVTDLVPQCAAYKASRSERPPKLGQGHGRVLDFSRRWHPVHPRRSPRILHGGRGQEWYWTWAVELPASAAICSKRMFLQCRLLQKTSMKLRCNSHLSGEFRPFLLSWAHNVCHFQAWFLTLFTVLDVECLGMQKVLQSKSIMGFPVFLICNFSFIIRKWDLFLCLRM